MHEKIQGWSRDPMAGGNLGLVTEGGSEDKS